MKTINENSMKFELTKFNLNVPDKELIEDIITVAKKIERDTLTTSEYEQYGQFHPSTIQKRFGSWFKALELAKLKPSRSKLNIPVLELFNNIEEVWIQLGRQPRQKEMKAPLSKFTYRPYESRFGTWMSALKKFVEYINEENDELAINENISNTLLEENDIGNIIHKTKRNISERLRFRILMRDGFTCRSCGKSPQNERGVELHVDHIKPWSMGGETIEENLETKCQRCNLGKGNAFEV
jgi:5-methylcytosine-specific restriction endonuclease McrA